jgi:hypothetical protein
MNGKHSRARVRLEKLHNWLIETVKSIERIGTGEDETASASSEEIG